MAGPISSTGWAVPPPDSPLPRWLGWAGPLLAAPFGAGLALRRLAYRCGLCRRRRAGLPVISVGNLTVGGTGKTPAAAYIARGLAARGRKPAVIQRGYRAAAPGELNDEGRELARDLPGLPVLASPDRLAGARQAAGQGCDVAVLDDGFQHWRLARDLDIVLVDATAPFGGRHLLPWGRLREKPAALSRADVVILTRCDLAAPGVVESLSANLEKLSPRAALCRACHVPIRLRRLFAQEPAKPANFLARRRILVACGLAHPTAFFASLARLGPELAVAWSYPDHQRYRESDLREWFEQGRRLGAAGVVVTEKDAVKLEALPPPPSDALPVWALQAEFRVIRNEDQLWARIEQALGK